MQRAAASAAAKDAQSGSEDAPPTPKRPRLSNEAASPGTPGSELDAINAALAAEEGKRREAIARQAAEAGETEWVLDYPTPTQFPQQPLVVAADSLDTEGDVLRGGRHSFGNFKRKSKYVSRDNMLFNFIANIFRYHRNRQQKVEKEKTMREVAHQTPMIPSL